MGVSVGAAAPAFEGQLLAAVDVSSAPQGWFRLGEFPCDAPDSCNLNEGAEAGPEAGRGSDGPLFGRFPERLHAIASRKQAQYGE